MNFQLTHVPNPPEIFPSDVAFKYSGTGKGERHHAQRVAKKKAQRASRKRNRKN